MTFWTLSRVPEASGAHDAGIRAGRQGFAEVTCIASLTASVTPSRRASTCAGDEVGPPGGLATKWLVDLVNVGLAIDLGGNGYPSKRPRSTGAPPAAVNSRGS